MVLSSFLIFILQAQHLSQMQAQALIHSTQLEAQDQDDCKAQSPLAAPESTKQDRHSQEIIQFSQDLIILLNLSAPHYLKEKELGVIVSIRDLNSEPVDPWNESEL